MVVIGLAFLLVGSVRKIAGGEGGIQKFPGAEPQAMDGGLEVRPFFEEKLLAFGLEEEVAGTGGDEHAAAATAFDDSLVDQLLVAFEDGQGVDAIFSGNGADGGEGFAFGEEAVEDHGDDAASKLAVDWLTVIPLEFHRVCCSVAEVLL